MLPNMQQPTPRTRAEVQKMADEVDVSLHTMMAYLAGMRVQPRIKARIERALAPTSERPSTPPPAPRGKPTTRSSKQDKAA